MSLASSMTTVGMAVDLCLSVLLTLKMQVAAGPGDSFFRAPAV